MLAQFLFEHSVRLCEAYRAAVPVVEQLRNHTTTEATRLEVMLRNNVTRRSICAAIPLLYLQGAQGDIAGLVSDR